MHTSPKNSHEEHVTPLTNCELSSVRKAGWRSERRCLSPENIPITIRFSYEGSIILIIIRQDEIAQGRPAYAVSRKVNIA